MSDLSKMSGAEGTSGRALGLTAGPPKSSRTTWCRRLEFSQDGNTRPTRPTRPKSSDLSEVDWSLRPRGRPKGNQPTAGSEEPDPSAFCVLGFCVLCVVLRPRRPGGCWSVLLPNCQRAYESPATAAGGCGRRLSGAANGIDQRPRRFACGIWARHPSGARRTDYCHLISTALAF